MGAEGLSMDLNLSGRIAFVTGASRGIGRAIALALAAEGVHLALFGRDTARCEALAAELKKKYPKLNTCVVALDLEGGTKKIKPAIAKAVKALGGVDILINCAGGAYRGRLEQIPDDAWERYFAVKREDLQRVAKQYLTDSGRHVLRYPVVPKKREAKEGEKAR